MMPVTQKLIQLRDLTHLLFSSGDDLESTLLESSRKGLSSMRRSESDIPGSGRPQMLHLCHHVHLVKIRQNLIYRADLFNTYIDTRRLGLGIMVSKGKQHGLTERQKEGKLVGKHGLVTEMSGKALYLELSFLPL